MAIVLVLLSAFVLFGCTQTPANNNADANSDFNFISDGSATVPAGSGSNVDASDNPVTNPGTGEVSGNEPTSPSINCANFISKEDIVSSLKLSAGTEVTYKSIKDGCNAIWLDPVPMEGTEMKPSGNIAILKASSATVAQSYVTGIWGCAGKDSLNIGDVSCKNMGFNFAQGVYAAKLVSVTTTAGSAEATALASIVAGKIAGTN